jgi:hypothetical protein
MQPDTRLFFGHLCFPEGTNSMPLTLQLRLLSVLLVSVYQCSAGAAERRLQVMVANPTNHITVTLPSEIKFLTRSEMNAARYQVVGRVGLLPYPADLPNEKKVKDILRVAAAEIGANGILDLYEIHWQQANGWEWASGIAIRELRENETAIGLKHPFVVAILPVALEGTVELKQKAIATIRTTARRVLEQREYSAYFYDDRAVSFDTQLSKLNDIEVGTMGGKDAEFLLQINAGKAGLRIQMFSKSSHSIVWSNKVENGNMAFKTVECLATLPPSRLRGGWSRLRNGLTVEQIVTLFGFDEEPGFRESASVRFDTRLRKSTVTHTGFVQQLLARRGCRTRFLQENDQVSLSEWKLVDLRP